MTVRELIDELKRHPRDMEVVTRDWVDELQSPSQAPYILRGFTILEYEIPLEQPTVLVLS